MHRDFTATGPLVRSVHRHSGAVLLLGEGRGGQSGHDDSLPDKSAQQDSASRQAPPEMREMAQSMKSMAEMCRTVMEREMQSRPIWIAAVVILGSLLTLALVLFIVLEVQWIRYWSYRLKIERSARGSNHGT